MNIKSYILSIIYEIYIYFIYILFNNPILTKFIIIILLICPMYIFIVLLSLFYKSNQYIYPLYTDRISNISKEEYLYDFSGNKNLKKENNEVIINVHGGAGIFRFPSIYSYKIFTSTIPNTNKYDKFYVSYLLVYDALNIEDIINSLINNLSQIFKLNYDKYILIADSMGGSILYNSIIKLFNTNIVKDKNIYTHLISPYIYYKNIIKSKIEVDYINDYIFNKYLNTQYKDNIAYIGNSDIIDNMNKEIISKIIKFYNIKIYYSEDEFLGQSIKYHCNKFDIPNINIAKMAHSQFFYLMEFKYNNNSNLLEINNNYKYKYYNF